MLPCAVHGGWKSSIIVKATLETRCVNSCTKRGHHIIPHSCLEEVASIHYMYVPRLARTAATGKLAKVPMVLYNQLNLDSLKFSTSLSMT